MIDTVRWRRGCLAGWGGQISVLGAVERVVVGPRIRNYDVYALRVLSLGGRLRGHVHGEGPRASTSTPTSGPERRGVRRLLGETLPGVHARSAVETYDARPTADLRGATSTNWEQTMSTDLHLPGRLGNPDATVETDGTLRSAYRGRVDAGVRARRCGASRRRLVRGLSRLLRGPRGRGGRDPPNATRSDAELRSRRAVDRDDPGAGRQRHHPSTSTGRRGWMARYPVS